MKVALVHDYIKEYGGAERVLEVLHELYPDATVYTSVYLPEFLGPHQKRFMDWDIRTSGLQRFPFKAKLISPFRLLAPFVFIKFNFSSYDLIIVSATGAYNPNIINKKNAYHMCYCHTPPRYLYGYATARQLSNNPLIKLVTIISNHFLRLVDFKSSQHVDQFIANSGEVKNRIQKFYHKDAVIIYPPISIPGLIDNLTKEGDRKYFLAGGRLARPKHVDVIVKAATKLNVPLKVFGKSFAGYGEELKKIAGPTVEFVGEISDEKKWELMQGAKAFLFASEDEDFGMVPVEAMSVGTPVIAYRSGGVQESVIEGKTGLFFEGLNPESLAQAIKDFEKMKISSKECYVQASRFAKDKFKEQISTLVKKKLYS